MYSKHLEDFVISINDNVYKASWKYHKNGRILLVLDNEEKFAGVITHKEVQKINNLPETATVKDIVNKNCKAVYNKDDDKLYPEIRNLLADFLNIQCIPILDNDKNVIDIFTREKAFWLQYYKEGRLPRMYYATCIYTAAFEAKKLGYDRISVIEFGVAGGNGLVSCEFHSREIARLLKIDIEIYGFDMGSGLPTKNEGYKDMQHIWQQGFYAMDQEKLKNRLRVSKLILGDIKETTKNFIDKYNPAPIGVAFIDVDYYSSTVPILNLLKTGNEKYFLPRIYTHFDDLCTVFNDYCLYNEFQGEGLAIKEFNKANEDFKIAPESCTNSLKVFHRFKHKLYDKSIGYSVEQLPYQSSL